MFIIQWTLFISNSQELRARGYMGEIVCVIYDFIGEIIFCWNYYNYGFLKSVKANKRLISQICIRSKKKNFGKKSLLQC